jgi:hypothetical protein
MNTTVQRRKLKLMKCDRFVGKKEGKERLGYGKQ